MAFRPPATTPAGGRRTGPMVRVLSGINLVLGLWLIIAPWVLHFGNAWISWDTSIAGIVIAIFAWARLSGSWGTTWLSWVNAVLGIWVAISPWVFATHSTVTYWNDVAVGIAIFILATWSALTTGSRTEGETLPSATTTPYR